MPRAGLTAATVVEAAADLADEVGWDAITLSALARRLGVADASLYAHVRSREDLRVRVGVLSAREFAEHVGLAVAGKSGESALVGLAGAYRAFAIERPGRYAASQMQLPPEIAATSMGHRRIIELTYAVLHDYSLPEPAATDAVRLLRSTFHGFASLEAAGGFGHPRDLDESWRHILGGLHAALRHWPDPLTAPSGRHRSGGKRHG